MSLAGHAWTDDLIQHAAEQGLQKVAKEWLKESQFIQTRHGERLVKKPAVVGIRKAINGEIGFQQTLWESLTLEQLWQKVTEGETQMASIGITVETAKRLIRLCISHNAEDVATALDREGTTLDAFLAA